MADHAAFHLLHALYSEHHGWLRAWLRQRLGCPHNAADVAQDTFMRLLGSRAALTEIREPRAFLTTTARRLLIDRARRQAIEQAWLAELAVRIEHAAAPSAETVVEAVDGLAQIATALERVSARAREAFLLHYLDGETHVVVARRLGVSERMVRKYLVQVLVLCEDSA